MSLPDAPMTDIEFFERPVEEQQQIETACRACSEFKDTESPECGINQYTILFNHIKKFQQCPKGFW